MSKSILGYTMAGVNEGDKKDAEKLAPIVHSYFSWSPDGQYLAVDVTSDNVEPFGTSAEPNQEQNIHRINVETGEVTILTTNDHSAIPEWRP